MQPEQKVRNQHPVAQQLFQYIYICRFTIVECASDRSNSLSISPVFAYITIKVVTPNGDPQSRDFTPDTILNTTLTFCAGLGLALDMADQRMGAWCADWDSNPVLLHGMQEMVAI